MENETLPELRRMSRLLALVAVKGLNPTDAAQTLSRAGYTQAQAGELLGLTANAVKLRLKTVRKGSTKDKSKSAKPRKT